jgi:hypothetical protein
MHSEAPGNEYIPNEQAVQAEDPVCDEKYPAGQAYIEFVKAIFGL